MAKRKKGAAGTPATLALEAAGIDYVVRAYEHDPGAGSYGGEAARALGVDPAQVFKTLLAQTDTGLVVGIVPVSGTLDLKALAAAVGRKKAAMADPSDAERSTGYVVGGISPIGQRKVLPTVLDDSARGHATILVSGGRRGLDLELAPGALVEITRGQYAPIARA
ncbi:MAG: Cys-tRNA(Pro) deacylase [Ornithinimicrobium sp.]